MSEILAPYSGIVRPLDQAPDPVFAAEMLGSGGAIDPELTPGVALAPLSGTVRKAHPHALVIIGADGSGVLLHLGIDTVTLRGEGFQLLVERGTAIDAGQAVMQWEPATVVARGLSPWVIVCVFETQPGEILSPRLGEHVTAGEALFDWPR